MSAEAQHAIQQAYLGGKAAAAPVAPAAPVYEAPVYTAPAAPVYTAPAAPSQPTPGFTLSSPADGVKKPGKKGGKGSKKSLPIVLAVAALVLVVGIVLVALNWNNWFGGSKGGDNGDGDGSKPVIVDPADIPEDPDDYIAYLHEAQAEGISKGIASAFGSYTDTATSGAMSVEAKIQVTLGKQLLDMLEDVIAESGLKMDVDWLKTISLIINTNTDSNLNESMNLALAIGKQKIVSMDVLMNTEDMIFYMGIPELSKKYVKMDMGEMGVVSTINTADMMAQLMEDMPSEQEMEKLIDGYMDIIAKYLDGAERREVTLEAGSGSEEVTALTITITEEELAEMIQELMEYTRDNKTARKIVQAFIDYAEEMAADDPYSDLEGFDMEGFEDFMDEGIEMMQDHIDQAKDGNYIEITTYANLAEIRGYDFLVYNYGKPGENAHFYCVHDGKKIYVDMYVGGDYSNTTITGELTNKSGKLSGELVLEIDGDELGTLELKNVNSDGYGTYVITPDAMLLDELGLDYTVSSLISGASFELEVKKDGLAVSIVNKKGTLITLDITGSTGKGSKISFPSNAIDGTDPDALESWAMGMDFGKLLDNLKKAGLPNDLYKMLKQALG